MIWPIARCRRGLRPRARDRARATRELVERAFERERRDDIDGARRCYALVLEAEPSHTVALRRMSRIARLAGEPEDALRWAGEAVRSAPHDADAHFDLGRALEEAGRDDDALETFQIALRLDAAHVDALNAAAGVLNAQRRPREALGLAGRAIALDPGFAGARANAAAILQRLRRYDEALREYDKAIALAPGYPGAYNNRGALLDELGRHAEAIENFDRAISLNASGARAWFNKAIALERVGRLEYAIESFDEALRIAPDFEFARGARLSAKRRACDWSDSRREGLELERAVANGERAATPFEVLTLTDSPATQRQAAETWVRARYAPAGRWSLAAVQADRAPTETPRPRNAPVDGRRIRIAYFSADFRNHAVSTLLQDLVGAHDRKAFELVGISLYKAVDAMRQRIERAFDQFHEFDDKPDDEIVRLARALRIDIAVDLGGFTLRNRFAAFQARVAPIQVGFLGYLGTSGSDAIDYLIADEAIIPAHCRPQYAESIAYLPWYQPNPAERQIAPRTFTRQALGLPPTGFVFCCFNDSYKISPDSFDAWMRILGRVDGSTLLLYVDNDAAASNLLREARARGIDPARLVFAARLPVPDYLARYGVADLFLDTVPYNAGTTASDALWCGTPVLTCAGKSFAGRIAASVLNAIGMPELVTETLDAYEELAVALATDPERMSALKQKLARRRRESRLFDPQAFARNLERAYREMHGRFTAGLQPQDIRIADDADGPAREAETAYVDDAPVPQLRGDARDTPDRYRPHAQLASKVFDDVEVHAFRMPMVPSFEGGVVLSDPADQRLRQTRNWAPCDACAPSGAALPVLEGEFAYGGPLYLHHFGHFMAECIHRVLPTTQRFQPRKWLFVSERHSERASGPMPPFVLQAFEFLGVDMGTVTIADTDMRVRQLSICEQGSDLWGGAKPGYLLDLDAYTSPRLDALHGRAPRSGKVYVSRSNVPTGGTFLGERYLETLLAGEGFRIFHPEQHPLTEQMDVYRKAELVVFPEGSACHGVELLGASALDRCYLLGRREDLQRRIFVNILQPRSREFDLLAAHRPLGTIVVNPATGEPLDHRGVCLFDVEALLEFLRSRSIASLRDFDLGRYFQAASIDLWRYVRHHLKHERRSTDWRRIAGLVRSYVAAGAREP